MLRILVLSLALATGSSFAAENTEADQTALAAFLSKLSGRRVVYKSVFPISNGDVEAEFTRETIFGIVRTGPRSVTLERIVNIKQMNWDLDAQKKRTGKPIRQDRSMNAKWEVSRRRSGGFWGLNSVSGMTSDDVIGNADILNVELVGNVLHYKLSTAGFTDSFAAKGGYAPGALECKGTIEIVDEKVKDLSSCDLFDVNLATMERTAKTGAKTREYQDLEE